MSDNAQYETWRRTVRDVITSDDRDIDLALTLFKVPNIHERLRTQNIRSFGAVIVDADWGDLLLRIQTDRPGGVDLDILSTVTRENKDGGQREFKQNLHSTAAIRGSPNALRMLLHIQPDVGWSFTESFPHMKVLTELANPGVIHSRPLNDSEQSKIVRFLACATILAEHRAPVVYDVDRAHGLEYQMFSHPWPHGCDKSYTDLLKLYHAKGMLDPHAKVSNSEYDLIEAALQAGNVGAVLAALELGTQLKPQHVEEAQRAPRNTETLHAIISERVMRAQIAQGAEAKQAGPSPRAPNL